MFAEGSTACVLTRTKKDVSLYSQAGRYWKEIEDNAYVFNRKFKTAETLKTVTKEDVMSLFENHIDYATGAEIKEFQYCSGDGCCCPIICI